MQTHEDGVKYDSSPHHNQSPTVLSAWGVTCIFIWFGWLAFRVLLLQAMMRPNSVHGCVCVYFVRLAFRLLLLQARQNLVPSCVRSPLTSAAVFGDDYTMHTKYYVHAYVRSTWELILYMCSPGYCKKLSEGVFKVPPART